MGLSGLFELLGFEVRGRITLIGVSGSMRTDSRVLLGLSMFLGLRDKRAIT